MTYKINGTDLLLQPSSGKWVDRDELDRDGNGHSIYPPVYNFELSWELMDLDSFYQLQGFYQNTLVTGSVVAELPDRYANSWSFKGYTGCIMQEPTRDNFWEEYVQGVKLLLVNIRT